MVILFLHNGSKCAKEAEKMLFLSGYQYISRSHKVTEFPKYDIGISFLYTYKIPPSQLGKMWYNFHPGPLPSYGGRNLCYHAIMNEEKEFGATIHYIDEEFDTGPIIECVKFPIEGMTAGEISLKSQDMLLSLLDKYLPKLAQKLPCTKQPLQHYYKAFKINDYIDVSKDQTKQILALTTDKFSAKILIGDHTYEIKRKK